MDNTTIKEGKTTAIVSYLTIVGTLIAFSMNSETKNEFAKFHIRQAFGLWITFFLIGILVSYMNSWYATSAFYIFIFTLIIYGFSGALQGKTTLVPIAGTLYQKWFKSL